MKPEQKEQIRKRWEFPGARSPLAAAEDIFTLLAALDESEKELRDRLSPSAEVVKWIDEIAGATQVPLWPGETILDFLKNIKLEINSMAQAKRDLEGLQRIFGGVK